MSLALLLDMCFFFLDKLEIDNTDQEEIVNFVLKVLKKNPDKNFNSKEFLDYFGLQHLRELPELPQLPDLQSIELELPIEEPDSSPETTQTLN